MPSVLARAVVSPLWLAVRVFPFSPNETPLLFDQMTSPVVARVVPAEID